MAFELINTDTRGHVGIVTLDRPPANALGRQIIEEIGKALDGFEDDDNIRCIILTGSEKVFAAGADIKEMADKTYIEVMKDDFIEPWSRIAKCRKPIIAAVAGHALGGGCEIAMMCDIIIAGKNAKFGQPEIRLGVMPGAGGTQRLTRIVGKSKAMEMCLTGHTMDAEEAQLYGLVSSIVETDDLMSEAIKMANKIADMSAPIVQLTKATVNAAYETTLTQGIDHERRIFQSMFATEDQKEGMSAFIDKREPSFKNK